MCAQRHGTGGAEARSTVAASASVGAPMSSPLARRAAQQQEERALIAAGSCRGEAPS